MPTLRNFIPFTPEEFLSGPYADWVLLILFCGLFIAVAGAVLPSRLIETRYGKSIVTFVGLIMGIGLFKSRDVYNFNLGEGFGFIGIFIIIFIVALVLYGMIKLGIQKTIAISLTYCIVFISIFMISPGLFDSISKSFPLLNFIFFVLFIYMTAKLLMTVFGSKNPLKAAKKLSQTQFTTEQDMEIKKEEEEDLEETIDIKKKTIPTTKKEIKSIEDIENLLSDIIKKIQEKETQLTDDDKKQISDDLKLINRSENLLQKGMLYIRRHVNFYNRHHKRDLNEIHQRMNKSKIEKQRQILQEEINFHKTMLQVITFLDTAESKVTDFTKSFNGLVYKAINKLAGNDSGESLSYLRIAKANLNKMGEIYVKQKWFEKLLLKYEKRLFKDLKKEMKAGS